MEPLAEKRALICTEGSRGGAPKWEGPYIVSEVHPNRHCILLDPDHGTTTSPINFKYVKKYYA
ncbi:hypothetical protein Ahy_Scaffold5g107788 [Arachis hypogaea]|uniref:Uncharacterized protein n=1 Tax=Arachis hypogaea TaxID=3818 RepID=A0A444WQ72_ARAHY|nr:hypothetical protein Ahy_Scaffold5g107783 [Arachis hypogaea]RYQ79563.1 hypothetical protein Ahy_Scaffold5g107788 [Arachis hypogaea]